MVKEIETSLNVQGKQLNQIGHEFDGKMEHPKWKLGSIQLIPLLSLYQQSKAGRSIIMGEIRLDIFDLSFCSD